MSSLKSEFSVSWMWLSFKLAKSLWKSQQKEVHSNSKQQNTSTSHFWYGLYKQSNSNWALGVYITDTNSIRKQKEFQSHLRLLAQLHSELQPHHLCLLRGPDYLEDRIWGNEFQVKPKIKTRPCKLVEVPRCCKDLKIQTKILHSILEISHSWD